MADKFDRGYVDPDEPLDAEFRPLNEDDEFAEDRYRGPLERRDSGGIDLTSGWVRLLATLIVIALGIAIILWALRPDDEAPAAGEPTPEATVDAADVAVPTFTAGPTITLPSEEGDATPEATEGEESTDGVPSGSIASGESVVVTGTDGQGVNLRESASTSAAIIQILQDDTALTIVGGPQEVEGFTWWQVSMEDGVQGWLVQDYLAPAAP